MILPSAWETPNNILSDATDEISLLPNGTPQINFKYCLRQVTDIVRACWLEEQLKIYARSPLTEPRLRAGANALARIQKLPKDWATHNEGGYLIEGNTREYHYAGAEVDEHFDYWQIDALVADNNRYIAIRFESEEEFHIYQFKDHTDFWIWVEEPCFAFNPPVEELSDEWTSFYNDKQVIKWQLAVGNIWLYGADDYLTPEDEDKLYWYVTNGNAGISPFFWEKNKLSLERE